MKFSICLLLALGRSCLAAQYTVDPTCDNRPDIKLRDGIIAAMKEGIDLAENAYKVMDEHGSDQYVQRMCKYVLGENNFQDKFDRAKKTFENVKAYSKEPSQFGPKDQGWLSTRSNVDVEIYCGLSRFEKQQDEQFFHNTAMGNRKIPSSMYDTAKKCYDTNFVLGSGEKRATAITLSSDYKDLKGLLDWIRSGSPPPKTRDDFISPTQYACSMDICTWFTTKASQNGWPTLTAERVETAKTEEFRAGLQDGVTPIDGLKVFSPGSTVLHELTHTNQGGKKIDVAGDALQGAPSCYGWKCVHTLANADNADTISMLGVALKIWTLKHWADDDGVIHPLTT